MPDGTPMPSSTLSPMPAASPTPASAAASPQPAVPGFGTTVKEVPKVPGFEVPLTNAGGKLEDRYDRRIIEKVEKEVLPRYDQNKDGVIDMEEAKNGRWEPPLQDSDLDKDGRVTRFEFYERYVKKMNLPSKSGVVYTTSTPAGGKPAEKPAASSDSNQTAEYAKGLLRQHDTNKNGTLEAEEWKAMPAKYHVADANKDNVITAEELTVVIAGFATAASNSSSGGGAAPAGKAGSGERGSGERERGGRGGEKPAAAGERKAYRFLSPVERLPKGLPDWFARNDANGDGQVMMAEYAASFNETVVAEFAKYDLNRDGVITPRECLTATEREKLKK